MRSLQVLQLHEGKDDERFSDLQVLRSPAGWYVGTTFTNGPKDEFPGLQEPGSRDTQYYGDYEDAVGALEKLEAGMFDMKYYRFTP